jgi:hypothetical protein
VRPKERGQRKGTRSEPTMCTKSGSYEGYTGVSSSGIARENRRKVESCKGQNRPFQGPP